MKERETGTSQVCKMLVVTASLPARLLRLIVPTNLSFIVNLISPTV
jgi:hypothetical protein